MAKFYPEVYDLRPWYHDFERLGLQTHFVEHPADRLRTIIDSVRDVFGRPHVEKGKRISLRELIRPVPASHMLNQALKEGVISPYIQRSLDEMARPQGSASALRCLDLFCADGYYSCIIAKTRPDVTVTGIDLDEKEIMRAKTAARLLGVQHAQFDVVDVWEFVRVPHQFNIILCTGGLYHLTSPGEFLVLLRQMCGQPQGQQLIVQSVVTLENVEPDYFVSPAPGWKHGSRFTHHKLKRWLEQAGWHILESEMNELRGNTRLCDRGSSYFHCVAE